MGMQIKFALKDIRRNLPAIIFFVTQLTIFTFLTIIVLGGLVNDINYQRNSKKIDNYKITGFKTYYANNKDYTKSTEVITYDAIEKCFVENKAASFIDTIRIKEHNDISVIIGIGMFGQVYGYDYDYKNDISVFIGSKVTKLNVGDSFEFGDTKKINLTVSKRLSRASSFFRNNSLNSLDNSILILMSYTDFSNLFFKTDYNTVTFRNMILQSNLNLINVNQYEIEEVTKEINKSSDIRVIPINYNNYIMEQGNKSKDNISFFIIVIIGFFTFILIGLFNNLLTLVDNNLSEYAIALVYGGTMREVYIRMFFYVFIIVFPSFLIAFNILNMVEIVKSISIIVQCFVIIIVCIIISLVPFCKLRKQNMLYFLRRDL